MPNMKFSEFAPAYLPPDDFLKKHGSVFGVSRKKDRAINRRGVVSDAPGRRFAGGVPVVFAGGVPAVLGV